MSTFAFRRKARRSRMTTGGSGRVAALHMFAAPTRGWVTNENLAGEGKAAALVLDDWFPTEKGIRARGGASKHATITTSDGVVSMIPYETATARKLFAASASAIYDITTPADPDVSPSAAVSGQTSGYYSYQQFETSGGDYMYLANGDDSLQLFDGSSWMAVTNATSPNITGVTTSDLSAVWAYRNRLFFVEEGTMNAWYLPAGNIGGVANDISLAGVFQRGGSLLFGATWSLDAGDGIDDKCVFVSTEGEIAVYEGYDPSSASTWSLVGRYDVGKPLGKRAFMRAGGDLLILTVEGVIPVSEALRLDFAALKFKAISEPIAPDWRREAVERGDMPWEMVKWPSKNMALVTNPVAQAGQKEQCFAVNLLTGAWARYTGWNTQSLAFFDDQIYFGDDDGYVYHAEVGGYDPGNLSYSPTFVGHFSALGAPTLYKAAQAMRAVFEESSPFNIGLSVSADYKISYPAAPSSVASQGGLVWDTDNWDEAVWDGSVEEVPDTSWKAVAGAGFALAPQIRTTIGDSLTPSIELVSIDLAYTVGEAVV